MTYNEGREARRNGQTQAACPYADGPSRANWLEGWRDSDAMLRALEPFASARES